LLPVYTALALLLIFFNIPAEFHYDLFIFYAIITVPVLLVAQLMPWKIHLEDYYQAISTHASYRFIILACCFVILLFGPADIYFNGFKLLDMANYTELPGIGRYVRHINLLCWIFIPVAFIFIRSRLVKFCFISYAILFPILIVDRNRLFLSCYSLFLCLLLGNVHEITLTTSKNAQCSATTRAKLITIWASVVKVISCTFLACTNSKSRLKFLLWLIPIIGIFTFAILGHFRTNRYELIAPTSGTELREGAYPLRDTFLSLPLLIQHVILYITTPIFNFVTVAYQDFVNQDFLLRQFSPFSRANFAPHPYAPILMRRFNVGTEFYPFLLYGGLSMVAGAFVLMLIAFLLALCLFKKYPNIFTFLIFIKISYNILFMGFAPQFYILFNLMFVVLMVFLWFLAEGLPIK
jgi:hypothetical protein